MRKTALIAFLALVAVELLADPALAGRRKRRCCCPVVAAPVCAPTPVCCASATSAPTAVAKNDHGTPPKPIEVTTFTTVSLEPIANATLNHLLQPPTGRQKFNDVPFDLPDSRRVLQTEGPDFSGPTSGTLSTAVSRPLAVYVLLSGGWVRREFKGKEVGRITLEFDDGSHIKAPIIAWATIRETWAYDNDVLSPGAQGDAKLVNVFTEPQDRGGAAATGFLDMLIIDLGRSKSDATLTRIMVEDTSTAQVEDVAPALVVSGVTVEHLREK